MEKYVGLDVSLKETSLCVVDRTGTTLWQGKCASTPESIAAVLARRAPGAIRIGLESGLLSTWHWHALKALGLPVVCLDARHVRRPYLNKTDANDAEGLAQIVRTGWYRQVQVKSLDSHLIRTLLVRGSLARRVWCSRCRPARRSNSPSKGSSLQCRGWRSWSCHSPYRAASGSRGSHRTRSLRASRQRQRPRSRSCHGRARPAHSRPSGSERRVSSRPPVSAPASARSTRMRVSRHSNCRGRPGGGLRRA
jgi:Transposase